MRVIAVMGLVLSVSGCGAAVLRADLEAQQDIHVLEGVVDVEQWNGAPIVAALLEVQGDESEPMRVFDYEVLDRPGASFSFLLVPPLRVRVIAFEDTNHDHAWSASERFVPWGAFSEIVIDGRRRHETLHLRIDERESWAVMPPTDVVDSGAASRSLRVGVVASLDDPRFGPRSGWGGLWQPMTFVQEGNAGLFVLEPYDPARTPVIFVHGISGYPQEFAGLIAGLDRARYQAWVAHYPSGLEIPLVASYVDRALDEVESLHRPRQICVVAHSMGGLVMRDALARHQAGVGHTRVPLFVTLATPFGGHRGAALGVAMAPVVVPAWRSLVPDGDFVAHLYDAALSSETRHALFFATGASANGTTDGVVPVASQRHAPAERGASLVRGFAETHTGLVRSAAARSAVYAELDAHCAP